MADDSMAGTAQATAPGAITFLPLLALPQALLVALYVIAFACTPCESMFSKSSRVSRHCWLSHKC